MYSQHQQITQQCIQEYNRIYDEDSVQMPTVAWKNVSDVNHCEILMATWNVCQRRVVLDTVKLLFENKIRDIIPDLFVLALQEVDAIKNILFGYSPNQKAMLGTMDEFFKGLYLEYAYCKVVVVCANNQMLFVYRRKNTVQICEVQHTVLTRNYCASKGALVVALKYKISSSIFAE